MVDVDPDTLLEWLSMGQGEERDMQLIALEQLCMLLLMSDNIDRCFERHSLRMAEHGSRGRERYAAHSPRAVMYVTADVGQYRPVFREVFASMMESTLNESNINTPA
ncbi:uncharacterized protein [Montipora foliosa]|uniref:uncharacterized protein isoform X2 n=1 Tax=Montipora foliosa TaxID=591990 RepID=UPI0035F122B1